MASWTHRHLQSTFGGQARTEVIVVLACVLALSSADAATVGAAASQLRSALHISNTDIGLLVAVSALVAAVASVPFGVLADRVKRTRALGLAIVAWGVAMAWSATVSSFGHLLLVRAVLGVVTAAAGPFVASLVGDYFPAAERGRVYGWILTGELAGAGVGFAVTGDIASLSWRAAFVILALPAFVLARFMLRLPEPARGGVSPLVAEGATEAANGEPTLSRGSAGASGPLGPRDEQHVREDHPGETQITDAQRMAHERGVDPDPAMVDGWDLSRIRLVQAVRYVLRIPTNVTLIVASACAYFYLAGLQTFAVEFAKQQYGINQAVANLLLFVLGAGAVGGTLLSGQLSDSLLRRGFLNARMLLSGVFALATVVMFVPALLTRSPVTALPYLTAAAFFLTAQNPPIDAARLDIMPSPLWGRAEGVRTMLRTAAQSVAPVLFGAFADLVFGGGRAGLQWTFVVMLLPLSANGIILLRGLRTYPRDVATAAAATRRSRPRRGVSDPRRRGGAPEAEGAPQAGDDDPTRQWEPPSAAWGAAPASTGTADEQRRWPQRRPERSWGAHPEADRWSPPPWPDRPADQGGGARSGPDRTLDDRTLGDPLAPFPPPGGQLPPEGPQGG